MLFKLSNLNSNLALTLGYLNPALNNTALQLYKQRSERLLRNCTEPSVKSRICKRMVVAYNSSYLIFFKGGKEKNIYAILLKFLFRP